MPQGDRTGPRGQGPLTGRGLGSCDYDSARELSISYPERIGLGRRQGIGRGQGLRFGRRQGRGFGRGRRGN